MMQSDTGHGNFVHRCIEEIGFGKFQILVMALTFTKAFHTASMISLVAIIEPYLRCKMNLTNFQASWIITAESFARIFSSACLGWASDLYGRQQTALLSLAMHLATSVLSALSSSFTMIVITRTAIGIFSPCRASVMSYTLETLPVSKRKYLSFLMPCFTLGAFYGLSAGIVSLGYLSWRWFIVIAEVIPLTVCIVLASILPESPRFLNLMNRHDEAVTVLESIATMNGKDPGLVRDLEEMTNDVIVEERDQETPMSTLEIDKESQLCH